MGYISENKAPLEKTWEYLFSSEDFFSTSIVSGDHIPSNRFFWNILYAQYLRDNGTISDSIIRCVIILSFSFAC